MCRQVVLAYADYSQPFEVEIDASLQGLGAVLLQRQDGQRKVIAFASRTLRGAERNMQKYSSFKLELLGLKWAVTEKFREYLLGNKFIVYTDNNPLAHLDNAKLDAASQRWVGALASFDFTPKYKPGRLNTGADALSRRPHVPQPEVTSSELGQGVGLTIVPAELIEAISKPNVEVSVNQVNAVKTSPLVFPSYTKDQLRNFQQNDPVIRKFYTFWLTKEKPSVEERVKHSEMSLLVKQWDKIQEYEGLLYRSIEDGKKLQLILPKVLQEEVLFACHDQCGHQGYKRTLSLIQDRCYWPKFSQDVASIVKGVTSAHGAKGHPRSENH
ncbi:Retrovirus polyprotein [Apostichopus japonicus]|uniref:Retrovirus polyprotein n=1 Tax=Stichopus japonicus TaxID=307972 RepID=A0A2G8L5U6_STIJA|nr:Retrovirus polyprotein [Apostichopus japonicus]